MAPATSAASGQRRRVDHVLRQHYTWRQRLRAFFYGRFPLLAESLISLGLLGLVIAVDVLVLLSSQSRSDQSNYSPLSALVEALKLLTFQSGNEQQTGIGPLLFAANLIFALFFIQTLIFSARAFFNKLEPQVRQRGLASTCTNHVIVCGLGRLGLRVATRLVEAGNTVVVVEQNWSDEFVPRALEMRVPIVVGDAKDAATLRIAGIRRACAVVAGIDDDLADVEIALAARALMPDLRVVLRAFNETFDQALERHFGQGTAFSVSAIAAPTFAAAMITRGVDHVLPVESSLLGVAETTLQPPQKGQPAPTLAEFERLHSVRVVAHTDRAGKALQVDVTRTVRPGERLSFLATLRKIEALGALSSPTPSSAIAVGPLLQHRSETYDTFIVCGHGKVGYRVVRWLMTQQPRPKVVVVHKGQDDTMRSAELDELVQAGEVEEVIGDATSPEVLRRAHIEQAFVVASVTSADLVNVQVGMEARRQRPDVHVVLRVFSDSLAENLPALFGIHTAYSTSNLASATLAAAAEVTGVEHAFAVDGRLYALDGIVLADRDKLVGKTVGTVRKQYGVVVAAHKQGANLSLLPPDDATFAAQDTIYVVSELASLTSLRNR